MIQISILIHSDQFKQKAIQAGISLAIPIKPQTLQFRAPRDMTDQSDWKRGMKYYDNILNKKKL